MFDTIGSLIGDIIGSITPMSSHWKFLDEDNPPMTTKQKVLAIALIILGGFVVLAVVLAFFILTNQ